MKHEISPDRHTLTITATPEEIEILKQIRDEDPEFFGTIDCECETLEHLICDSELEWISPANSGDLTDAPMLGILGDESEEETGPHGCVHTGGNEHGPRFTPILERWAFMDYQTRSFVADLADTGKAVFIS